MAFGRNPQQQLNNSFKFAQKADMDVLDFAPIEKEEISGLHFPAEEILTKEALRKERTAIIDRAISLGNLEHVKVKIYFQDDISAKVVNTTIWGVTDKAILLKQNVVIPIQRIIKLEI